MTAAAGEHRSVNLRRPFSRAEARAAGITLRELLSARFHKIIYDCYIASTIPITVERRAQAALAISPTHAYASHFTAAQLWGAVVPEHGLVHVSVPGEVGLAKRPRDQSQAYGWGQ